VKFVRLEYEERISYGILEDDLVHLIKGNPFSEYSLVQKSIPTHSIRLLAPCEPSKIIAVGVNYEDHAVEGATCLQQAGVSP